MQELSCDIFVPPAHRHLVMGRRSHCYSVDRKLRWPDKTTNGKINTEAKKIAEQIIKIYVPTDPQVYVLNTYIYSVSVGQNKVLTYNLFDESKPNSLVLEKKEKEKKKRNQIKNQRVNYVQFVGLVRTRSRVSPPQTLWAVHHTALPSSQSGVKFARTGTA